MLKPSRPQSPSSPVTLSRRELLAGVGAGAAALLLERPGAHAQPMSRTTVVFSHTTVVLEDATLGGAGAVRQRTLLGSLEVGKKADLIVVDTQQAHLVPAGRIVSAWIHNGRPSDVVSVMVDGQFIMRNRKVLTMDEDGIVAEADKVGRRIWGQVQAAGPVTVPGRSRQR